MKKNLTITINNPCLEDWDKMTTNKDGKFCNHCKENVIDFTLLSDKEIIRIFDTHKGKLCGRFSNDQLERPISFPSKKNRYSFLAKASATFLLFTLNKEVNGQRNNSINNTSVQLDKQNNTSKPNYVSPIELVGTVFDASTNKPISNAKIIVASPVIAASFLTNYKADFDGSFSISLPDSSEKRTIKLIIAADGYQESTVNITPEDYFTQINVYLSPASTDGTLIQTKEPEIKKTTITLGMPARMVIIDKPKKKHFNFWNLFRSKKNRK